MIGLGSYHNGQYRIGYGLSVIGARIKMVLRPGIEPGTYRVLGGRHNQLDHRSTTTSSEGLEPPISRFVVSRLIQLGHEDIPMLLALLAGARSHWVLGARSHRCLPPMGDRAPRRAKWFPDRDLNPGLNGESVVS